MGAQTKPTRTSQRDLDEVVLQLLPRQGNWSEGQYLWLTDHSNHLIEYTDGYIEVLPMPTRKHQAISRFLFLALVAVVHANGGTVFYSPLRLRIREEKYREPDLMLLLDANDARNQDRYWLGADLVVEIVSPDDPDRDLVEKRRDYAEANIPEYWIVDPRSETIVVLRLRDGAYVEHGVFGRGDRATSTLLTGFAVDVSAVFDAE
jgi:Uma2 family endonuclease